MMLRWYRRILCTTFLFICGYWIFFLFSARIIMLMFYLLSNVFRGILISMEDGTLKFLSLPRIANDVPATGRPFVGTKTQGVATYQLSEYLIWSVHASDTTGTFSNHLCHNNFHILRNRY